MPQQFGWHSAKMEQAAREVLHSEYHLARYKTADGRTVDCTIVTNSPTTLPLGGKYDDFTCFGEIVGLPLDPEYHLLNLGRGNPPGVTLRDALRSAARALLQAAELVDGNVSLAEPLNPRTRAGRATLTRLGYVSPGHFNGLGSKIFIEPGATGILRDHINRNCWARALHVRGVGVTAADGSGVVPAPSEVEGKVVVTSITYAGWPVNIGNLDAPVSQFENFDLERDDNENLVFLFVGQSFQVCLRNDSDRAVYVSGGFDCDEMTCYGEGALLENTLRRSLSLLGQR